jgi:uncharacterized protein
MDGYTTIATQPDGVYLTVFPPTANGKRITLGDVERELAKYKVTVENRQGLNQLVMAADGKPHKIARPVVNDGPGHVFVELSEDEMIAKITAIPPQDPADKWPTLEEVRTALQRQNVVFGVDESRMAEVGTELARMAAEKDTAEPLEYEVAFGTPVLNGEDARIDYIYKELLKEQQAKEEAAVSADETDDGRIDYRALHKIENVAKGTVLARKIPPSKGTPGKTVTGKTIEAREGKNMDLVASRGVLVNPDNPDEWIADADGQVIVKDNKLSVMSLYEVNGDVDFSTGNIDFVGTVVIRGDIKDGFKVFTGEDLIVNGVVEAAELKAGGKLTIAGGISGSDRARISCQGDANIKYIRNSYVEVGGSLTVNQAIMHSQVKVGTKVTVAGKKGVIVGGQVIAGEEVNAASMGSNFATPTEVVVGEAVGLRDELQRLENELKTYVENLEKTKKGISFLKDLQQKSGGNLPAEKKELLTKLTRAQFKLMADVKSLSERKGELDRKEKEVGEERRKHAKVMCLGVIHTGVKITINKASRQIAEELKYCSLTEVEGEVKVGPYGR